MKKFLLTMIATLALALAAQDTAANLFGSVTILIDNPFKIGDWVKVKDMEGTVEEIGFRSTRIRTFTQSPILKGLSIRIVTEPKRLAAVS
jgi:small-conductance mechanosensitive channel